MTQNSKFAPADLRSSDLSLDVDRIIQTIVALEHRIEERFPGSGLGKLAGRLQAMANITVARLEWVARPILKLRLAVGLVTLVVIALPAVLFVVADLPATPPDVWEFIQAVDAGVQDLIFVGLLIFFLYTLENRIKRRRALHFIRELRALAHIIDLHQLTKDPDRVIGPGRDTPSSPERDIEQFKLGRYLDYCSEMLSLTSKVAALYAQSIDDPVVLAAVDEIERLTNGLSAKLWQKIFILDKALAMASRQP
jgi:hypothetical protein